MKKKDWHASVYKTIESDDMLPEEWKEIRNMIIERDKRRCYRCDLQFHKKELNVHHIMPRRYGGSDSPSNLITLCPPCHDIVEIEELFTKAEIMGSYTDKKNADKKEKEKTDKPLKEESFERPSWHKYVYGGVRH